MRKAIYAALLAVVILAAAVPACAANEAYYQKALEYYVAGEFDKAISMMKLYVSGKPDPGAYYLIGYSYYKLGDHGEANKYFEYAFLIDPEYSPTPEFIEGGKLPPKPPKAVVRKKAASAAKPAAKLVAKAAAPAAAPPQAAAPKKEEPMKTPPPAPAANIAAAANAPAAMDAPAAANAPAAAEAPTPGPAETAPPEAGKPWAAFSKWVDFSKLDFAALLVPVGAGLVVYLAVSLLLSKVAKRRGIGRAWLAWVPVLQIATLFSKPAAVATPPEGEAPPGLGLSDMDFSEPRISSEEEAALNVDLEGTAPSEGEENPFEFDLPSEEPPPK